MSRGKNLLQLPFLLSAVVCDNNINDNDSNQTLYSIMIMKKMIHDKKDDNHKDDHWKDDHDKKMTIAKITKKITIMTSSSAIPALWWSQERPPLLNTLHHLNNE